MFGGIGIAIVIATVERLAFDIGIGSVDGRAQLQERKNIVLQISGSIQVTRLAVIFIHQLNQRILHVKVDGINRTVFIVSRVIGAHIKNLGNHVVLVISLSR